MSNEFEQPVEPMSRAEEILREENVQRPMSRVEDLLQQLVASGSNVTVTPTLNTGVPLAYVTINGVEETIYAPEDVVGSIVTVSPTYDTGTLVATITVNDVPYYIYVPTELPTVTSSDEGKVLTVNSSGKWNAESAREADVVVITVIPTGSGLSLPNGMTTVDVANLNFAGKFVVLRGRSSSQYPYDYYYGYNDVNDGLVFYITKYSLATIPRYATETVFVCNRYTASQTLKKKAQVNIQIIPKVTSADANKYLRANSSGNGIEYVNSPLPSVTSSDEGKVLTVNSSGQWVASAIPDGTNTAY